MKCVFIVDDAMPTGLIANTTAALGISLGSHIDGLIGQNLVDGSGRTHKGITNILIPVLVMDSNSLTSLHNQLQEEQDDELILIGFSQVAQRTLCYEEYAERLLNTPSENIQILGMCLYGKRKRVNKLTGNLKMLR